MRIVGFKNSQGLRLGVVEGDQVIDLQAVDANLPADLGAILRKTNGDLTSLSNLAKRAPASARIPLKGLTFALPVANPGKIVLLGLNYMEHVKEGPQRDNIPKFPTYFMRGLTSLTPHEGPIVRPKVSDTLDYEAELVIVIGKRVRGLTKDNAYSAIAGWSCFNDGSVREWQRRTTQWDIGKNFDSTGGFGPWMVTRDDIADGQVMTLVTRLNGQEMQRTTTDKLIHSIPRQIAHISAFTPLAPGDVIVTGTPGGVGAKRTPPVWMKPGDMVEVEVDAIGILRNGIRAE